MNNHQQIIASCVFQYILKTKLKLTRDVISDVITCRRSERVKKFLQYLWTSFTVLLVSGITWST